MNDVIAGMVQARARFLELVADVRPELHRYCARMAGNVFDGEDIVQDTLAKAHFALSELAEPPPLRPWLFRIAHNTAMDFLRRTETRQVDVVAEVPELAVEASDTSLIEAAFGVFLSLPPTQRSALLLKDVLGHSLEETAGIMNSTVPAIKGALTRARLNLSRQTKAEVSAAELSQLANYARLFNAHDWEGLREVLADDVHIELVARWKRTGAAAKNYFTRYAELAATEVRVAQAGHVDGQPCIAVSSEGQPTYFICLTWAGERVSVIRDFYFVPYLSAEVRFIAATL